MLIKKTQKLLKKKKNQTPIEVVPRWGERRRWWPRKHGKERGLLWNKVALVNLGFEADDEAMDVVDFGEPRVNHVWGVWLTTVWNWSESKCDLEEIMGVLVHFVV